MKTVNFLEDQITPHFRLSEFICTEDGNSFPLTVEFMHFLLYILEPFRVWYNRPINITSGYRSERINKKYGGVANSLHLKAMAIDFWLPEDFSEYTETRQNEFLGNMTNKWFLICRRAGGFGQVCWYDNRVHMGFSRKNVYFEDKRGK